MNEEETNKGTEGAGSASPAGFPQVGIVEHWRCGEPRMGKTLVWVPEGMTSEEFRARVRRAQEAFLAFVKEWRDEPAPNDYAGWGRPDYSRQPNRTVAEIDAEWEAKRAVWAAWDAERQKAYRSFGEYLEAEGLPMLWRVSEGYPYAMELDWGHRHGWRLETDSQPDEDLSGPLKRRGLFDD